MLATLPRLLLRRTATLSLLFALPLTLAAQTPSSGPDFSALTPETAQILRDEEPIREPHAMVVTVHHLATDAGVQILREGGNAVDAAVAVGFALEVVYPFAGNIGGGGFMLIHERSGRNIFLDYREEAPLAATPSMYLDAHGNVIPHASTIGYRSIGVPGSEAGLVYAERHYGSLTLKKVMAPAIRLATDGFILTPEEAHELHHTILSKFPVSREIFQRNGDYYKAGDRFRRPLLAATLRKIAADPGDFYHGAMARQIAAAIQKGGGLITVKDLARYQVKVRQPIVGTYRGYTILSAPPPSSGGVTLMETLNILSGCRLRDLTDRSPQDIHLIVEAFRRAYMDRNAYLGDPDYVHIPVAQMLSMKYAAAWRATISPLKATPSASLVRPAGFLPPPPTMKDVRQEAMDTTHYSIMDAQGDAVAVTTTLNGAFGSGVTVPGLGFLLNDEMDDFTSKPGVPNMYGLIQGPANAIAPGKRPLSSMTPTIVLSDGKVAMVLGSPGGATIITTVANIFLSVAEHGFNIQQAVDAPRFHNQYLPDAIDLEPGFSSATISALRRMGYKLVFPGQWGNGECIEVDPKTDMLEAGQDHRQNYGKASGY